MRSPRKVSVSGTGNTAAESQSVTIRASGRGSATGQLNSEAKRRFKRAVAGGTIGVRRSHWIAMSKFGSLVRGAGHREREV